MTKINPAIRDKLWSINLILIIIINCCSSMSFQVLTPTLPIYIQHLGYKEVIVGFVIGIFTVTTILFRPFIGKLIDVWNKKMLLIIGISIVTIGIFLYQFSSSINFLITIRLIHGLGWGIVTTSTSTIASDVIPKNRLAEGFGYYGLSTVVSLAIGPAVGLYLLDRYEFTAVFNFATLLIVVGFILSLLVKYKRQLRLTFKQEHKTSFIFSVFERTTVLPSLLNLFISLTLSAILTYLSLYAFEINVNNIGWFFTVYAVVLLIMRPLSGYFTDKKGFYFVLLPGILSVFVSILFIIFAKSFIYFIIAAIFYGIGWGIVNPCLQALVVHRISPERRGVANSTFLLSADLAFGLGAILWGVIASYTSYKTMFMFVLVPLGMAVIIYYILKTRQY